MCLLPGRRITYRLFRASVLAMLLGCGLKVQAANLSFRTAVIASSEAAATRIDFNPQDSRIIALQFDLQYDRDAISIDITVGSAAAAASKSLVTTVLPNGDVRVVIFGFNQVAIRSGGIADLTITANESTPVGAQTICFRNIIASTGEAQQSSQIEAPAGRVVKVLP